MHRIKLAHDPVSWAFNCCETIGQLACLFLVASQRACKEFVKSSSLGGLVAIADERVCLGMELQNNLEESIL
jgi:hypothetical protein